MSAQITGPMQTRIAQLEEQNAALRSALEYVATGGESWKDCCRVARSAINDSDNSECIPFPFAQEAA